MKKILAAYTVYTYDVWGNDEDGWDVNDTFERGTATLELEVITHNTGTNREFDTAFPTDKQLEEIFGCECSDNGTGDGQRVYCETEDGYPVGELRLVSHDTLSPLPREHNYPELFGVMAYFSQDIYCLYGGSGQYDSDNYGAILQARLNEDDRATLLEEYASISPRYWANKLELTDEMLAFYYVGTRTGSGSGLFELDNCEALDLFVKHYPTLSLYQGDDGGIYI